MSEISITNLKQSLELYINELSFEGISLREKLFFSLLTLKDIQDFDDYFLRLMKKIDERSLS